MLFSYNNTLVAKYLVDPYASIDWDYADPCRGNFHTHGEVPDGDFPSLSDVINLYDGPTNPYKFLAITDHNVCTDWTPTGSIKFKIRGCESGGSNQQHIGSLFCTYGGSDIDNMETRILAIRTAGGLAIAHHPIRAITSDAIRNQYTNLFKTYDNFVGLEVYSFHMGRHNSQEDWDKILTDILDDATPAKTIWGLANDDMHSSGVTQGTGWNVFPLCEYEQDEAYLRQAMVNGSFYFSIGAVGSTNVPVIKKITADALNLTINITMKTTSCNIRWYTDNHAIVKNSSGVEINNFSIDCKTIQNASTAHFVRAMIWKGSDTTFTQPFVIKETVQINSIQDLYNIRSAPYGKYLLTKDLDFDGDVATNYNDPVPSPWTNVNDFKAAMTSGTGWIPIAPFNGDFDGQSYSISNLFINDPSRDYAGLFALNEGKIANLGVDVKSVTGKDYTGGLSGGNNGLIVNCYAAKNVSTSTIRGNNYVGGIFGFNNGNIQTSYAKIDVNGTTAAPYWDGAAGGFVGWNYGTIENSYARGNVTATSVAGGFVGFCMGTITNCYSTGQVSPVYGAGGFVGCGCAGWTSCYWDMNSSGLAYSTEGIGKTTAEMQTEATYTNWNFSGLWRMAGSDYPILAWQKFDGGSGSADDEYQVKSVAALCLVNRYVMANPNTNVYFGLEDNVDLTEDIALGEPWVPVGTQSQKFQGHVNGHGHKITGLKVSSKFNNYIGLFGYIGNNAVVENLEVEITSPDSVYGNVFVGGLAGWNDGIIRNCCVTGTGLVIGNSNSVGGLVGRIGYGGRVLNSYTTIATKGDQYVGGLIGVGEYGGQVTNSYSKGLVSKLNSWSSGLGGLIGTNMGLTVTNCYWDQQTSGQTNSAGGIGRTTLQMQQQTTFSGWDFVNIWNIVVNTTYPFLR